jgi:Penicillin binding protein transpeptidase domain/NTF2-like N-terminal transpeptidase domain
MRAFRARCAATARAAGVRLAVAVRRAAVGVVSVVVVAGVAAGSVLYVQHRAEEQRKADRRAALAVAQRFLADWSGRRYDDMDTLTARGDRPGDVYRRTDARLQATAVRTAPGPLSADGRSVPFTVSMDLTGLGRLDYAGTVDVVEQQPNDWRVAFRSATVHPSLTNGQQLQRRVRAAPRGTISDRKGRPIRSASEDLAANVLGRNAPSGRTGLERVLDSRLAGTLGGAVVVGDAASSRELSVLKEFPAKPPSDVRTTLDLDVQRAAERALAGAPTRAALVAVDTRTGEVRAVANSPVAGVVGSFASYAPGSTFKIITATAALQHGVTLSTTVQCPETIRSGGRIFRNYEGEAFRTLTFAKAFALSCNTAFLGVAEKLPDGALEEAARLYGFGREQLLPIAAEGGSFPTPRTPAELAADAIGQGTVEASPLIMATVSAAVASGTWHQPRLLPGSGASTPLPAGVAVQLRALMRGVVTGGTGKAAQGGGGPVSGKTGTAEYGNADPPLSHAWFTGYRGSLAFAVYVETGKSGGTVAAPLVRQFLAGLPG